MRKTGKTEKICEKRGIFLKKESSHWHELYYIKGKQRNALNGIQSPKDIKKSQEFSLRRGFHNRTSHTKEKENMGGVLNDHQNEEQHKMGRVLTMKT